jgi:hypothetical protein
MLMRVILGERRWEYVKHADWCHYCDDHIKALPGREILRNSL